MTRFPDDHDFSVRGLDIRPPRPEETEWVRQFHPRLVLTCSACGHYPMTRSRDCEPELWCGRCGAA